MINKLIEYTDNEIIDINTNYKENYGIIKEELNQFIDNKEYYFLLDNTMKIDDNIIYLINNKFEKKTNYNKYYILLKSYYKNLLSKIKEDDIKNNIKYHINNIINYILDDDIDKDISELIPNIDIVNEIKIIFELINNNINNEILYIKNIYGKNKIQIILKNHLNKYK